MTMKQALAIGFGGMKATPAELRAAAQKLRSTKSKTYAASYKMRASELERRAA